MTNIHRYRKLLEAEYDIQPRNGQGTELFLPRQPRDFTDVEEGDFGEYLFTELPDVVRHLNLAAFNALLLNGEPGSGKSHLKDDLTMAVAAVNNVPFMTVRLEVNGGKATGPDHVAAIYDRLIQEGSAKNLVVLDNVDFLGYRGHSRTRGRARQYAAEMSELINIILHDDNTVILGTAHDEEWRSGRWIWDDAEIDQPAQEVLNYFDETFSFAGILTPRGLEEVLHERGYDRHFVDQLALDGMRSFFMARHLDFELYRIDPKAALTKVWADRQQRKTL